MPAQFDSSERNETVRQKDDGPRPNNPPPPPPELFKMPLNSKAKDPNFSSFKPLKPSEEVSRLCLNNLEYFLQGEFNMLYSVYHSILPILQDGPVCGLVALEMAQQLICDKIINCTDLLKTAAEMGFTKQGEMFSARNLVALSRKVGCKAEVCPYSKEKIIEHILKRKPVLCPYDSDRNHEPCLKNGHSAHWAVLSGFLVSSTEQPLLNSSLQDDMIPNLIHCSEADVHKVINLHSDLFFLARHGKSRNLAAWNWSVLKASNKNLVEVSPKRAEEEYVIPSGGLREGLSNQIILLS